MTTTIRARGAHELLAYIPFQLRYHPDESVVLVGLRPPGGEVGLVARMDIADLADIDTGPDAAEALVRHVVDDGAGEVFLACYTNTPLRAGGQGARAARAAVEHCREAAEAVTGPVRVWVVTATGYADLDCHDAQCCPPGGRDLADLTGTVLGAEMVARGAWAAASREEWMRIAPASEAARRDARLAAAQWARRRSARSGSGATAKPEAVVKAKRESGVKATAKRELTWRRETFAAWLRARRAVQRGEAVDPSTAGVLAAGLRSVPVRDAVLLSTIPGAGHAARATLAGLDADDATGRAIASIVDPRCAVPPPSGAERARKVLESVVAHGEDGPGPLTLLGILDWWAGDGSRAGERVREALDADAGYRLALLLDSALRAGVPPGWVRRDR